MSLLRPVSHADYAEIYRWSVDPRTANLWRYRGGTPSPDVVLRQLWDGAPIQYVVRGPRNNDAVGLVGLYNANHVSRYAYLFALSAPEFIGSGITLRGSAELLDYAFQRFRLRKVYIECSESSLAQYRSGLRAELMVEEGRLRQHEWNGTEYEDLVYLSISAESWTRQPQEPSSSLTVDELLDMLHDITGLRPDTSEMQRSSLGSLGLDSLDFAALGIALEERCGRVEFEISDGMIDQRWTLLELHHFANAFLERAASLSRPNENSGGQRSGWSAAVKQ